MACPSSPRCTPSAASLTDLGHALGEDVLVCGDKKADKARVIELIQRIDGLRRVDCGKLETARITESLTVLLIGINARYKTHAVIRITGLPTPPPTSAPISAAEATA